MLSCYFFHPEIEIINPTQGAIIIKAPMDLFVGYLSSTLFPSSTLYCSDWKVVQCSFPTFCEARNCHTFHRGNLLWAFWNKFPYFIREQDTTVKFSRTFLCFPRLDVVVWEHTDCRCSSSVWPRSRLSKSMRFFSKILWALDKIKLINSP